MFDPIRGTCGSGHWGRVLSSKLVLAAAVLAVTLSAAPAGAAVVVATYTGQIIEGSDPDGVFGTPTRDLADHGIIARLTFDTRRGTLFHDRPTYREVRGNGTGSPFLNASVTINGHTEQLLSWQGDGAYGYANELRSERSGPFGEFLGFEYEDQVAHYTEVNFGFLRDWLYASVTDNRQGNIIDTVDPAVTFDYVLQPGDTGIGSFTHFFVDIGRTESFGGAFNVTRISVAPAAAVPELSTWALLLSGFGLAGAALRQRRLPGQDSSSAGRFR